MGSGTALALPALLALSLSLSLPLAAARRTDHMTYVSVGDRVTARIQYARENQEVLVDLLNGDTIHQAKIAGASPAGGLKYTARLCPEYRSSCDDFHTDDPEGWSEFPSGELVLVLERRPSELAIWLQGHPERRAEVPVPPPQPGSKAAKERLRITRSGYGARDMPFQFTEFNRSAVVDRKLECADSSGMFAPCPPRPDTICRTTVQRP